MDSRVGFSIHLAAGAMRPEGRLQLRDGELLTIRVDQQAAKNRYTVTIRGITLTITSNRTLLAGTTLHARVAMTAGRIELKVLRGTGAPSGPPLESEPLSIAPPSMSKAFASVVMQAMQRTGLAVTTQAMAAIAAMVPHLRQKDPAVVRFAAILYDKHLKVDPERLEELYLTIGGERRRETSQEPAGQHRNPNEGQQSESGDVGTHRSVRNQSSEKAGADPLSPAGTAGQGGLSSELAAQFRAQSMAGGEAGWQALFNHLHGARETWVIIPFNLGSGRTNVDGSVRLLIDASSLRTAEHRGRVQIRHAVVVANGVGAFEIRGAPPERVSIHAESVPKRSKILQFLPELEEKLRNLGVKIDDTNNGGAVFDGFTAEAHGIRSVDASA